jgi:hypothetical protein
MKQIVSPLSAFLGKEPQMDKRIIYQTDEGGVAIICPAPEALGLYGIEAIAVKDVPAGKPYKIVDVSEIPTDRSNRDAWTVDEADLTDGFGGESNEFPAPEVIEEATEEVIEEEQVEVQDAD